MKLTGALVFSLLGLVGIAPQTPSSDVDNYYVLKNLRSLPIGTLKLSSMRVSSVTPGSFDRSSGRQAVSISLEKAHVVLSSDSSTNSHEVFSGDLAEGTPDVPAAIIKGQITWSNRAIRRIDVEDLKFRLKSVHISTAVGGSKISVQPTSTAIVVNRGPLISGSANRRWLLVCKHFRFHPKWSEVQFEWVAAYC